jgi:hypothetical protein
MESPSPARWPQRLMLAAASSVLALLLAEFGFRIHAGNRGLPVDSTYQGTDLTNLEGWLEGGRQRNEDGNLNATSEHHPVLGWVPLPNLRRQKAPGVLSPFSTNSRGMRGRTEFAPRKPEGLQRVALIGDSFTFGLDKPDPKIWAHLLAERVAPAEVLNFGVSGYGTDQACLSLPERALEMEPDVVVWGIFVYDPVRSSRHFSYFAKSWFALEQGELKLRGVPVPTPDELIAQYGRTTRNSYALYYLRRYLDSLKGDALELDGGHEQYMLRLNRAIMDHGRDLARAGGAELLVVLIPTSDWPSGEQLAAELDIRAWAGEVDCPLIDLREVFTERGHEHPTQVDLVHYVPDYHFSPEGHSVVAETIAAELKRLGWL